MKKALLSAIAVSLVTLSVQALPNIDGSIVINGDGAFAIVDQTLNTVTITPSAPLANAEVDFATDDFLPYLGDAVTYQNFTYSPLAVVNPIWQLTLTPTVYFDLLTVTSITENSTGILLGGMGIIYIPGYEPTTGEWSFNASTTDGLTFSFGSTTTAVPDGGTTLMLLGAALSGLGLIRRKIA